jgi:hypothetical protein
MKYFITYGDSSFSEYRKQIVEEVESTKLFDKIISYSHEDLGKDILSSEAFKHKKGGGYWSWKPYIIDMTLDIMSENDILVYCDVGCTISNSKKWNKIFDTINHYDIVGSLIQTANIKWCRNSILEYFKTNGDYWRFNAHVTASHLFIRKTLSTSLFIQEWKKLVITRPDLLLDVSQYEIKKESIFFKENRADQSIFNGLVYKYIDTMKIKLVYSNYDNKSIFKRPIEITRKWRKREAFLVGIFKLFCYKILNVIYYYPKFKILLLVNKKSCSIKL